MLGNFFFAVNINELYYNNRFNLTQQKDICKVVAREGYCII